MMYLLQMIFFNLGALSIIFSIKSSVWSLLPQRHCPIAACFRHPHRVTGAFRQLRRYLKKALESNSDI